MRNITFNHSGEGSVERGTETYRVTVRELTGDERTGRGRLVEVAMVEAVYRLSPGR